MGLFERLWGDSRRKRSRKEGNFNGTRDSHRISQQRKEGLETATSGTSKTNSAATVTRRANADHGERQDARPSRSRWAKARTMLAALEQ